MKKHGVLNRELSIVLSQLGHTDKVLVADCGLPIPIGMTCIDLTIRQGDPSFMKVVELLNDEMEVEQITLAEEVKEQNPMIHQEVEQLYDSIDYVSHEQLKEISQEVKAIIRTGENTPYANVILHAGVIF
ncbi:D-ribose pyranase [Amphibacillus sp. Q70]|uniref:D-ribose pyranase n=1 Tax=Amphibacillus sp. Q70 TaxID=3453416 RepID=UPI003F875F80